MVDLAKIRKKAKKSPPDNRQPTTDNAAAKLEAFLATAGKKREGVVQETIPVATDEIELLTFILGQERYAIDIDGVAEIISTRSATRVPNTDPFIVGIISVRGSIVTLVDVRSKLKQPARGGSKDSRIIVVRHGAGLLGFDVDRVLRPAKIERTAIEPQPVVHPDEESDCIRGVVRGPNALTIVLDLAKLVGQPS